MSKAKDRSRAKAGQPHISGNGDKPEDKLLVKCQYPPCDKQLLIEKPVPGMPYTGKPPFCEKHLEWLEFHMWCSTVIRIEKQQTPSGIVLPGNEKYEAKLREQPFIKP